MPKPPRSSAGKGRTPRRHTPPLRQTGPRELAASLHVTDVGAPPFPDPPRTWTGTRPEWAINWAHLKLGKRPGIDFQYQGGFLGGHKVRGGLVVDFIEYDPPNLALDIQGLFWHYRRGAAQQGRDRLQRAQLVSYGVTLIFIDEDDALASPIYFLREALAGRDHSRLAPGR